jgi:hypothetical protein
MEATPHRRFGRKTLGAGFVEVVAALGMGVSVILPSLMIGGFSDPVISGCYHRIDLLVEPMPNEGHFEYMRQRAAALKKPPPEPPKPAYAPGSLEYERQQAERENS